jgi:hypothetical protein
MAKRVPEAHPEGTHDDHDGNNNKVSVHSEFRVAKRAKERFDLYPGR